MARKKPERATTPLPAGNLSAFDQLIESLAPRPATRPKDSITAVEYAARFGLSRCSAARQLEYGVEQGRLKKAKFLTDGKVANFYVAAGDAGR